MRPISSHASAMVLGSIALVCGAGALVPSSTAQAQGRSTAAPAGRITVGKPLQISAANADRQHGEAFFAIDPNDSRRMLACSLINVPNDQAWGKAVVYASLDGGASWHTTLPQMPGHTLADPACGYGPDGTAYLALFAFDLSFESTGLLYRSTDGGRTWLGPIHIPRMDAEFITIDRTGGRYDGMLYIVGLARTRSLDVARRTVTSITFVRSSDRGATIDPVAQVAITSKHLINPTGNGVVFSDGSFGVILGEDTTGTFAQVRTSPTPEVTGTIKFARWRPGGVEFDTTTIVSSWYAGNESLTGGVPMVAVDETPGPFRDRVYAVWPDIRNGRSCILFSYSTDRGLTWGPPIQVNDNVPRRVSPGDSDQGAEDFMPMVAVNRNGVVGVAWYDRRASPGYRGYSVRFSASLDGGETFLSSVSVAEDASDPAREEPVHLFSFNRGPAAPASSGVRSPVLETEIRLDRFPYIGGDYSAMPVDASGAFHPAWIGNRTGVRQVWTARITVRGTAAVNGGGALATLRDVSDRVTVRYANLQYDRRASVVSGDAFLVNVSRDTVQLPLTLRITAMASDLGRIQVMKADNDVHEDGAAIEFRGAPSQQGLAPGASTSSRHIELRILDPGPIRVDDRGGTAFARLRMRVLSPAEVSTSESERRR